MQFEMHRSHKKKKIKKDEEMKTYLENEKRHDI